MNLQCPHCKKELAWQSNLAGRLVRCPFCNGVCTYPKTPPAETRRQVADWLPALRGNSRTERRQAIEALAALRDRNAIEPLKEFIRTQRDLSRTMPVDRDDRRKAMEALRTLGGEVAPEIFMLLTACSSDNYRQLSFAQQTCLSNDFLELVRLKCPKQDFGYDSFPEIRFDQWTLSSIFTDLKSRGFLEGAGLQRFRQVSLRT